MDEPADGRVAWRPHHRPEPADFTAMADALELTCIPARYRPVWALVQPPHPLPYKGLRLELILPWNEADLDLLKENLIGHLLMLRKLKRPLLFIATTRNEMTLVSLDNESGQVWLEWLDSGRRLVLAPSCRRFWSGWRRCRNSAGSSQGYSSERTRALAMRQGSFYGIAYGRA
ncbi:SecY-interacting protein Syd [Aeromonas sp. A-5]